MDHVIYEVLLATELLMIGVLYWCRAAASECLCASMTVLADVDTCWHLGASVLCKSFIAPYTYLYTTCTQ